ncbi:aldehyde dehydrogenase family protein [Phytohabitans kaempferiae]|uniref:Aldehyde dehydrogenase family protein n=1 Tax=Phytohabitans kaempferiae TaxID=1620943 RepID=A0ABV6MI15_9ACTN
MYDRESHYIGGRWVRAAKSDRLVVHNPADEAVLGHVPAGTPDEAALAVAAAVRAFDDWASRSVAERSEVIRRFTACLKGRAALLAKTITEEVGSPASFSARVQVGLPLLTFDSQPTHASEIVWHQRVGHSMVLREAAGVVVAITPWNYPLHQIAAKIAPALMVGCTVILKPSELAPFNAYLLAEAADEAELPDGVLNVVFGTGAGVGSSLVAHPDVDVVSFTGSNETGRIVSELASRSVKQVHLELGGKSPNVVLDDADLEQCVAEGVARSMVNSGQTCTSLSRLLVPKRLLSQAEEIAASAVANHPLVDPSAEVEGIRPTVYSDKLAHLPTTFALGPLVSANQRERVVDFIRRGVHDGARLVAGGPQRPSGFDQGYYVLPTIFSNTTPDMSIVREEIFGPVLCLQAYDGSDDSAVTMANETPYGLAAAVRSKDPERALAVARRIRAGQVEINQARFNPFAPFGGFKQSGHGRELGTWGLEAFLQTKSIQLPPSGS